MFTATSGCTRSRLLSPCGLDPRVSYRAALVPAFLPAVGGGLADAWGSTGAPWVELPLYDTLTLTTSEQKDDFLLLAGRLHVEIADALGDDCGHTAIRLRDEAPAEEGAFTGLPPEKWPSLRRL